MDMVVLKIAIMEDHADQAADDQKRRKKKKQYCLVDRVRGDRRILGVSQIRLAHRALRQHRQPQISYFHKNTSASSSTQMPPMKCQ
ncbi:MAG: hypothetical protein SF339_25395 [Blastocatellia bacterium]|nr:hypothetical protein [Blastocatellia bacterium]